MEKGAAFKCLIFSSLFLYPLMSYSVGLASPIFRGIDEESCLIDEKYVNIILEEVRKGNDNAISSLSGCLRTNHKLIFRACFIDPSQLSKAEKMFQDDENFIIRLVKVKPEILIYASKRLKSDKSFIERASYINRDSIRYADQSLLNDRIFMKKMVENDSRNYMFGSEFIKKDREISRLAFQDDGKLIIYAPENIKEDIELVKIALNSTLEPLDMLDSSIRNNSEIISLVKQKNNEFSKEKLEKFLRDKYVRQGDKKYIGYYIDRSFKIHKKNTILDRKYVVKWQKYYKFNDNNYLSQENKLITAVSRNYPNSWKDDLLKYPTLVKKIENFFIRRHVDKDTIDNLLLTYLWKIPGDTDSLGFNLYLLRESRDKELGSDYVNVTSLTAIANNFNGEWKISVIDAIFDNEIKTEISYRNGHKRYFLQDLYFEDAKDKKVKIIFRVEDRLKDYFEIYTKDSGNKYHLTYRIDPVKVGLKNSEDNEISVSRTREEQEEFDLNRDNGILGIE